MVKVFRMLVLIVDDNKDFAEMLKENLREEGIDADYVIRGQEAVDRIITHEYQVIFMDMIMPGMNGVETLEKIRAMGSCVPAVVVTGFETPELLKKAKALHIEKILKKPVKIAEIISVIQSVIQNDLKRSFSGT